VTQDNEGALSFLSSFGALAPIWNREMWFGLPLQDAAHYIWSNGGVAIAVAAVLLIWWGGLPLRWFMHRVADNAQLPVYACLVRGLNDYSFVLVYLQTLGIALAIIIFARLLYGPEHDLEAVIIVAATITLFFTDFGFAHIAKPSVEAALLPTTADHHSYLDSPSTHASAPSDATRLFFIRITNIGFLPLESCTVTLQLPNSFEVLDNESLYEKIDHRKRLTTLRDKHYALFEPHTSYMSIAPGGHLFLPVQIRTPPGIGDYDLRVLLSSLSRWGEARKKLKIQVRDAEASEQ